MLWVQNGFFYTMDRHVCSSAELCFSSLWGRRQLARRYSKSTLLHVTRCISMLMLLGQQITSIGATTYLYVLIENCCQFLLTAAPDRVHALAVMRNDPLCIISHDILPSCCHAGEANRVVKIAIVLFRSWCSCESIPVHASCNSVKCQTLLWDGRETTTLSVKS